LILLTFDRKKIEKPQHLRLAFALKNGKCSKETFHPATVTLSSDQDWFVFTDKNAKYKYEKHVFIIE